MKTESIVATLLKGSHNIDSMRREIDSLTKLLIGIIFADSLLDETPKDSQFRGQYGRWRMRKVSCIGRVPCVTKIVITYTRISEGSGAENWVYSTEPDDNMSNPRMESVQPMWQDLEVLVEGIVKTIPNIKGFRWNTLTEAAKVVNIA